MTVPTYIDQTGLEARYGAEGLARMASASGLLDAEAITRVAEGCTDVNAEVDAKIQGLGIDTSTSIPAALTDIAARLARRAIFRATWNGRGIPTPKSIEDDATAAEAELDALAAGEATVNQTTPARQVAARFSWQDVGNCPSDDNPRTTVAARMRRLP